MTTHAHTSIGGGDEASSSSRSTSSPVTPTRRPASSLRHSRSRQRSASSHSVVDRRSPPPAPRAPGRTFRLSDDERQKMAKVSRILTYDDVDDNDADAQRTPTRRSARTAAHAALHEANAVDRPKERRTPPPTFLLPAEELSPNDLLARKRLGSPINLNSESHGPRRFDNGDVPSSTSSATSSPSHSFRSSSASRSRRKRLVGQSDENDAPFGAAASPRSDASPRRQQPKRSCTAGTHSAPVVVMRQSLGSAKPSRALNAPTTWSSEAASSSRARQSRSPAVCSPALSASRHSSSPSCFDVGHHDYFSSSRATSATSSSLAQAH